MNKVLEIEELSFSYDKFQVLENLNMEIHAGEFVALIGENGTGKSTLLNLILKNLKPNSGKIKLFGDLIEINNHYSDIAYISQNSVLLYRDFPTTVEEVIKVHLRYLKSKENADQYLKVVGLEEHRQNTLSELSGGQLQRVALVLALIKKANFIILDEPTSGIDKKFSIELFKTLRELSDNGNTILMVTHNLRDVVENVDRVIRLENGCCQVLNSSQLQRELA